MRGKSWTILAAAALLAVTGIGASTGGKPPGGGGKPPSVSQPQPPTRPGTTVDPVAAARCRAQGGTYGPVCLTGTMQCVMRFADAGRPCTDGSQCEGGSCYYDGPTPARNVRGTCVASDNPCGCHGRVEHGDVVGALCVD
jgi:hypothetical protein